MWTVVTCVRPAGARADSLVGAGTLGGVRGLVGALRARGQLRGLGGELLRQAACRAVAALAAARLPVHGERCVGEYTADGYYVTRF